MEASENTSKPKASFLGLPLEIRNEIYSHLLTGLNICHPDSRFSLKYSPQPLKYPSRLSILLVNCQVHDEAARVFYGGNTFSIHISLSGYIHSFLQSFKYQVEYTTPWEHYGYDFEIDGYRNNRKKQLRRPSDVVYGDKDTLLSTEDLQRLQGPGLVLYPSPKYRHLIRNIRLKFTDHRLPPDLNSKVEAQFDPGTIAALQTPLLPFLWRLRELLTEKATVEIEVDRVEYGHYSKRDEQRLRERRKGRERALEAVYILTRGPWKSTFELSERLEKIQKDVFEQCEERPEFQEDALQKMMQDLQVDLQEETFWGVRDGVLTIFNPSWRPPPRALSEIPVPDPDPEPPHTRCCFPPYPHEALSESDSE